MTLVDVSEQAFQQQVVELARVCRWRTMHVRRTVGRGRTWTTSTSVTGWPDLAIWRPGQFLLVELKSDTGKVTPDQQRVLSSLCAAGVDVRVWRPKDWEQIVETLRCR